MPHFPETLLISLAVLALIGVLIEEYIHVNKAKITLFLGALAWLILYVCADGTEPEVAERVHEQFESSLTEIASLWLFLMSAMTFVTYLNQKGLIENLIYRSVPRSISEAGMLYFVGGFCFLFSALADNMTATLVAMTLINALRRPPEAILRYVVVVIFAVNSGGVSLITGDVTTLMIFLHGKVGIVDLLKLVVPAFSAVMLLCFLLSRGLTGRIEVSQKTAPIQGLEISIGLLLLGTLLATMGLNVYFSVPPVLTFLFGLSVMFLIARFFDQDNDRSPVLDTLRQIEFETLLFFLGILLLVGMLQVIGVLHVFTQLHHQMSAPVANALVGLLSALIDNVPLTAALLKSELSMSTEEWLGLTYAVGVGGSMLVIGSAAGIVAMSRCPQLTFMSYLRYTPVLFAAYAYGYAATMLVVGLSGT